MGSVVKKLRAVAWQTLVVLAVVVGVCIGEASDRSGQSGRLELRRVYTYRLPSAPDAYWALPVPDRPWIVVAELQRPSGNHGPRFRVSLVDWRSEEVLASEELSTHLRLDSPRSDCPSGAPLSERLVAAFENTIAVKLCARLMTFQLPSLNPMDVLLDIGPDGALEDLASSADGRFLAVVFRSPASGGLRGPRKIVVYDTTTWKVHATLKIDPALPYIHSVSISGNGRYVVVASPIVVKGFGDGDHIYVFDSTSSSLISEFDLKPLPGEAGYHIPPFFFAGPQSQWLLSGGGGEKERLYLWDWRNGKVARVIADRGGIGRPLDVSSDGLMVAADVRGDSDVAMYFPIRDFKIFDVQTGLTVNDSPTYWWKKRWGDRADEFITPQLRVQFSRDGKYFVDASGYDEVVVYSVSR